MILLFVFLGQSNSVHAGFLDWIFGFCYPPGHSYNREKDDSTLESSLPLVEQPRQRFRMHSGIHDIEYYIHHFNKSQQSLPQTSMQKKLYVLYFGELGFHARSLSHRNFLKLFPTHFEVELWAIHQAGSGNTSLQGLSNFSEVAEEAWKSIEEEAQGRPIFLMGSSLGTLSATYLASRHPEATGVILRDPVPLEQIVRDWYDRCRCTDGCEKIPCLRPISIPLSMTIPQELNMFKNARKSIVPLLMISSLHDSTSPISFQLEVLKHSGSKMREFILLEDSYHIGPIPTSILPYIKAITQNMIGRWASPSQLERSETQIDLEISEIKTSAERLPPSQDLSEPESKPLSMARTTINTVESIGNCIGNVLCCPVKCLVGDKCDSVCGATAYTIDGVAIKGPAFILGSLIASPCLCTDSLQQTPENEEQTVDLTQDITPASIQQTLSAASTPDRPIRFGMYNRERAK